MRVGAAEGQREHGADDVTQALRRGERTVAKRAVLGHAGGDERMRNLQQDGARPRQQHQALCVDAGSYWHELLVVNEAMGQ